jgi:hypothetical protein
MQVTTAEDTTEEEARVKRVHDSFNIPVNVVRAAGGPVAASETSRSVAAPHTVPPSTRNAAAASPHPLLARALSAVEEEAVKACGHPLLRERAHVDDVTINAFLEVVEKTHCLSPNVQPPTGCGQIENSGQPPTDHVQVERSGQSPTCDGRAEPPTQPGECACPGQRVWFGWAFLAACKRYAVFCVLALTGSSVVPFPMQHARALNPRKHTQLLCMVWGCRTTRCMQPALIGSRIVPHDATCTVWVPYYQMYAACTHWKPHCSP